MTESTQALLALSSIPMSVVIIIVAMVYSAKRDCAKIRAKVVEDSLELNALLETVMATPKTRIVIETFEGTYDTIYFDPYIGRTSRFGKRTIISSASKAQEVMEASFDRGYFIDYNGVHIPCRLLRTTKFKEAIE